MSNVVSKSDPFTSSEITALQNLTALGVSGTGQFIQKTGATTFVNTAAPGVNMFIPAELPDGTRTVFTVTDQPKYVLSEQGPTVEGVGYTYLGGFITFFLAPSQFIRYFV